MIWRTRERSNFMQIIFVIGRVAKEAGIRKDAKGNPYAIVEITTYGNIA